MSSGQRIAGAGLCATSWSDVTQACRISSQLIEDRKPQQNIFQPGNPAVRKKEDLSRTGAMPLTPLASVSWNGGNEVRLFYLNSARIIFEFTLVTGSNVWKLGTLHTLRVTAIPGAGLAATLYQVPNTTAHEIRVYYQDDAGIVRELIRGGNPNDPWKTGTAIPTDARFGTELAAVTYPDVRGQIKTHLFYQAKDLKLQEVIFELEGGWKHGDFIPVVARGRTPLAAITFVGSDGERAVQLYWCTPQGRVYHNASHNDIWGDNKVTSNKLPAGCGLAVIQWNQGLNLRLYYQKHDGPELVEWQSNDGGIMWSEVGPF